MKFLRVRLERVYRTDLMCIGCGKFRTEWALVTPGNGDDRDPEVGIHTGCISTMHAKRGGS